MVDEITDPVGPCMVAKGDADAMNNLGGMYLTGSVVESDYAKAAHWFRQAVALGNVGALTNLGTIYSKGLGVEQDYAEALKWFRKGGGRPDQSFPATPIHAQSRG